jgi:hypothetical protein
MHKSLIRCEYVSPLPQPPYHPQGGPMVYLCIDKVVAYTSLLSELCLLQHGHLLTFTAGPAQEFHTPFAGSLFILGCWASVAEKRAIRSLNTDPPGRDKSFDLIRMAHLSTYATVGSEPLLVRRFPGHSPSSTSRPLAS